MLTLLATPFSAEGQQLAAFIRSKATNDEIEPVIQSIEEQARTTSTSEPLLVSTDAFVTAICYIGSKSLSHLLSCIERNKDRLLSIGAQSAAARRQIITSVMSYWKDQPGVGVNIVDKLLNYTILTPISVIEWALITPTPSPVPSSSLTSNSTSRGTNLAISHIYELIALTVRKVCTRVRQLVAAYRSPSLPEDQRAILLETLERERADMKQLFAIIDDALLSITTGSTDEVMQGHDQLAEGDQEWVGKWGQRWKRVFQRKIVVEESWYTEEMAKPIPEPEPVAMEDVKVDETAATNGSGVVNGGQQGVGNGEEVDIIE